MIQKLDQQWNFNTRYYFYQFQAILGVDINNTKKLYVSSNDRISCFDSNLNIPALSKYFFRENTINSIYYNKLTDHLLSTSGNGMFSFTLELEFLGYYSFTNATTTSIVGYNGILFVSTTNGLIWVLENETFSYSFRTLCSSITKLRIDQFGYIAVICSSTNIIYIYSTNGTNTGVTWSSPIPSTADIGFDASGNLVVVGDSGIYLYH